MQHVEPADGVRLAVRTWGEPSGRQEIELPPDEAPEPVPFDRPVVPAIRRLPDASLATVEAGHHAHSSEPAAFLQVVRRFLAVPAQG